MKEDLLKLLNPLIELANSDSIEDLELNLEYSGLNPEKYQEVLKDIQDILEPIIIIEEIIENFEFTSYADFFKVIKSLKGLISKVIDVVTKLNESSINVDDSITKIGEDFLSLIILKYLKHNHPKISSVLKLVGITTSEKGFNNGELKDYELIKTKTLVNIFKDPKSLLIDKYNWNTDNFDFQSLILSIREFLIFFKIYPYFNIENRKQESSDFDHYQFILSLFKYQEKNISGDIGLSVFQINPKFSEIVILPYALGEINKKIKLEEGLSIMFQTSADINSDYAIIITPEGFDLKQLSEETDSDPLKLSTKILLDKSAVDEERMRVIGSDNGTKLEVGSIGLKLGATIDITPGTSVDPDFEILFPITDGLFVINSSDQDGFLAKILPEDGIRSEFNVTIGWSLSRGFHFEGSAGLDFQIPTNIQLGPIEVRGLQAFVGLEGNGLKASLGADVAAELGPVKMVVENVGVAMHFAVDEEMDGNLGLFDVGFGFKPPNGIGISIDASVVKGGGYLYIDSDKGLYYGAAELTINELVSVKAIAIINTKLPDGSEGYSFLVLISAEFSPIQLGLGFTLSGVGGLVGVHRGMEIGSIAGAVMDDTLKNMLFPEDPVGNITGIMSSLNSFFPIEQDSFTFGILLSLGWGSPQLVDIELGLVVSIPDKFSIVGILKLLLPDPKSAVVKLQVNFMGAIDFKQKYAFFYAELFDSEILIFQIEGSLFFYLDWGDPPYFVFSIGGFHPTFTLPKLKATAISQNTIKRLQLRLIDSDNPKLLLEFYFAVTSNTVQFGAALDFKLDVEVAQVVGFLHFDALFQFNPFYFIVSLRAGFQVLVGGSPIMGITYSGTLEGPTPWHLTGYAEFTMFIFMNIRINIDETFGEEEEFMAPGVEVLPMLQEALLQDQSWQLLPPKDGLDSVVIREIVPIVEDKDTTPENTNDLEKKSQPDTLVAHPNTRIILSQSKIPLQTTLDKIGEQSILDYNHFSIRADIDGDGEGDTINSPAKIQEYFARAQFKEVTEEDKLTLASFEKMDAGIELTSDRCFFEEESIVCSEVEYEMQIIDAHDFAAPLEFQYMPLYLSGSYALQNAITRSQLGENTIKQRADMLVKSKFKFKQPEVQLRHSDVLAGLQTVSTVNSKTLAKELIRKTPQKEYQLMYDYELQNL